RRGHLHSASTGAPPEPRERRREPKERSSTMIDLTRRAALLGSTAALAAPAIVARAADTIRIGVVSPQTGAAAESGQFMRNGIALAVDAINAKGGVLGRRIETLVADDQTTNPGAVLAFSKLASDAAMVGFIGSIRSTPGQAMAAR